MHTDVCAASGFRGRRNTFRPLRRGFAGRLSPSVPPRSHPALPARSGGAAFGRPAGGYPGSMTDDRTEQRAAELLPEELAAGSADPEAQAAAILAESDEREYGLVPTESTTPDEGTLSG